MNINKQKIFALSAVLTIFITTASGCGTPVINSEADEIRQYKWEYRGEQGIVSTLEFKDDLAELDITSSGEHCKINGLCVFGDDSFVIIDNNLKKEYLFEYTLTGKKLSLSRNDSTIVFKKTAE